MIHLRFKPLGGAQEMVVGPAARFRIAGNFIRKGESREIVAQYANHFWHIDDQVFTTYETSEKVLIHFEDAEGGKSPIYGPFNGVKVIDGSCYIADELFAKFMDTSLVWHDHQSDTFWPNMVIAAA